MACPACFPTLAAAWPTDWIWSTSLSMVRASRAVFMRGFLVVERQGHTMKTGGDRAVVEFDVGKAEIAKQVGDDDCWRQALPPEGGNPDGCVPRVDEPAHLS